MHVVYGMNNRDAKQFIAVGELWAISKQAMIATWSPDKQVSVVTWLPDERGELI
jgi:hypothetical protein